VFEFKAPEPGKDKIKWTDFRFQRKDAKENPEI